MNYIPKIAELLGVEVGEHFKLKYNDKIIEQDYCLDEGGLYWICDMFDNGIEEKYLVSDCELYDILSGECEIIKKPWKPEIGENYWYYGKINEIMVETIWEDASFDYMCWKAGNCFRTEYEAETKGKELMEQIMKEYENA